MENSINTVENNKKECSSCKRVQFLDEFKSKRGGKETKMCASCRGKAKRKECKEDGCEKHPSYGLPGTNKTEYCKKHAPDDYEDIAHKRCKHSGCKKHPSYGLPGSKKTEYCKNHAPDNYEDIAHKRCKHSGCKTNPTYGLPGSKKREYCKNHAPDNYEDIASRRCKHSGCKTRPHYGLPGSKKMEYCSKHAPDNYEDIANKRCKHSGCKKHPHYGLPGSKKKEYCSKHAPDNYEDIANKRCKHSGCEKQPNYGLPGSKKKEYCRNHAPDNYEDIANKRCKHSGCKTRPSYGKLFTTSTHCSVHKTKNMYSTINPKCEYPLCKNRPFYTSKGKIFPLRCEDHALQGDSNVVERECSSCHLLDIISDEPSFKGQCNICNDFQEYKQRKEHIIMDILKLHDLEPDLHDKIYDSNCSKKRVDAIYDCKTHYVLLEIDEHQHSSSQYNCERVRMINLSQEFGGTPVIFLRFNPDSYRDQFEEYVAPNIEGRMFKLIETIQRLRDYKPTCLLSVVYLYYDLFVETDIPEVKNIKF